MIVYVIMLWITTPLIILLGLIAVYYLVPEAVYAFLIKAQRTAAGLKRHRIDVAAMRFYYLEGGRGEALVLLHGFAANKEHWTRIGRHLTPHFRVIAPDLIGFGESSRAPDGDYTIRAQVARLDALVEALGIASFHLGGSSMGGHIAGAYAAAYPHKVKSLLLIAPGGVVTAEPSEMQRRLMAGGENPLVAGSVADFDRTMDFVFDEPPFVPRPVKLTLVREAIDRRSLNIEIFEQIRQSLEIAPLEDLLKGRTVPALIVWGAQDRVLHVSGAVVLAAAMPNARTVVMEATGHLPMIEKPRETAEAYLYWLQR